MPQRGGQSGLITDGSEIVISPTNPRTHQADQRAGPAAGETVIAAASHPCTNADLHATANVLGRTDTCKPPWLGEIRWGMDRCMPPRRQSYGRLGTDPPVPPLRLSSLVGVRPTERMRSSMAFACARLIAGVSTWAKQHHHRLTPGASPVQCDSSPRQSGRYRPRWERVLHEVIRFCARRDGSEADVPEVLLSR